MRAANTGISAVIDGAGASSPQAPLGVEAVLDGALPEPLPADLATTLGLGQRRLDRIDVFPPGGRARAGGEGSRACGELPPVARNARIG